MTTFFDMNGVELHIGDYCKPTEGQLVRIVEEEHVDELNEDVLVGQQVEDPMAFSRLTKIDLSTYFRKVTP